MIDDGHGPGCPRFAKKFCKKVRKAVENVDADELIGGVITAAAGVGIIAAGGMCAGGLVAAAPETGLLSLLAEHGCQEVILIGAATAAGGGALIGKSLSGKKNNNGHKRRRRQQ